MKQISICAKVKNGNVLLYIRSSAQKIRILRERIPEAKFTTCNPERAPDAAEIIFEGVSEKISSYYVYKDTAAAENSLYYYWITEMGEQEEIISHPVLVRVRSPRLWWPRETIQAYIDQIAEDFPQMVEVRQCGYTTRRYPLRYLWAGNKKNSIVYIGAVHPGESGPEILLPSVRHILENQPQLLEKVGMAILPAVCADCREDEVEGVSHYLRTNPNGVDINRNFPADWETVSNMYGLSTDFFLDSVYRGYAPGSEAETQAVLTLMEEVKPRIAFSCHWLAGICEDNLLASAISAEDEAYQRQLEEISDIFSDGFTKPLSINPPRNKKVANACTGGRFPTWCYRNGIPAFDLEGGRHEVFLPAKTDETTEEMLALAAKCHESAMCAVLRYAAK